MMSEFNYPLAKETINHEDIDKLIEWLKTYPKLTQGNLVKRFERKWANYIGTNYSVFVNSGSSANLLMLYALLQAGYISAGSKVVVPAVGWGTTIAPLLQLGLIPVIVDVDEKTFGLDSAKVEEKLVYDPGIKAVLCVHALGVPCNIKALQVVCNRRGVYLLEDSCAALGSKVDNKTFVGSLGDLSSFSFYFGHQLSTIEGGMINTNDETLYNTLLMARSHGWLKDTTLGFKQTKLKHHNIDSFHEPFTFIIPGFNLRGTDLQAKLGLEQLKKAEYNFDTRFLNHMRYCQNFKDVDEFFSQDPVGYRVSSISFGAVCRLPYQRRKIVEALTNNGIETRLYSAGNLARHPFITKCKTSVKVDSDLAMADKIHEGGFFLPNYPELKFKGVDFICDVVKAALK